MADELADYDKLIRQVQQAVRALPSRAATVAVNFTKERFRQQNWLDNAAEPWEKRKKKKRETRTDRRHVLVQSGRLMRSIRKISSNSDRAIIGTDVDYARIHNDGGTVQATANVKTFNKKGYVRKAHTRTRNGRTESIKTQNVAAHQVKAHRRTVHFTMPQRQFIGNSAALTNRIEDLITKDIIKALTL